MYNYQQLNKRYKESLNPLYKNNKSLYNKLLFYKNKRLFSNFNNKTNYYFYGTVQNLVSNKNLILKYKNMLFLLLKRLSILENLSKNANLHSLY